MGLGPSKAKIRDILIRASSQGSGTQSADSTFLRCNHRITTVGSLPIAAIGGDDGGYNLDYSYSSSADEALGNNQEADKITDETSSVDCQSYPNRVIGTVRAVFKQGEKTGTCFLIENNVVATAASNVYDTELGGKAKEVYTTFSEEKVKAESINILPGYEKMKKRTDCLATIAYSQIVLDEWLGVELPNVEALKDKDLFLIASVGESEEGENDDKVGPPPGAETMDSDTDKKVLFKKSNLHQINVTMSSVMSKFNDKQKIKTCIGAPVFYKEGNSNSYVVGILSSELKLEQVNAENMRLLVQTVIKAKDTKKNDEKKIEEEKITKLDLSRNDFGPLDIKFLSEFNLKNLIDLDLSSNSIKPQGVFYFTQGKFPVLKTLNLNFNEIGDEGLFHLSNAVLNELEQLFLFHNNISKAGVEALCKADFAQNLVVLSLSENQNIMDEGVQCFEKQKNWRRLMILNLNRTGLTDQAVKYLIGSIMPNLKKIHLKGNNFTSAINHEISAWKLNGVMIDYLDDAQKRRRRKRRQPHAANPGSG